MSVYYWKVGCILGGSSILLGAFGAHSLKKRMGKFGETSDGVKLLKSWETAVHYQLAHAIALLALSSIPRLGSGSSFALRNAAFCWTVGTLLFSGSIYGLVLTNGSVLSSSDGQVAAALSPSVKAMRGIFGPATPVGGVIMTIGWISAYFII